jgi:hypothetical protein
MTAAVSAAGTQAAAAAAAFEWATYPFLPSMMLMRCPGPPMQLLLTPSHVHLARQACCLTGPQDRSALSVSCAGAAPAVWWLTCDSYCPSLQQVD